MPSSVRDHPDYRRGFRDACMDALLPRRPGARAPMEASAAYRAGYEAGGRSVRMGVTEAA